MRNSPSTHNFISNVLILESGIQCWTLCTEHCLPEKGPSLGHWMAVVSTGIELRQEIHWFTRSLKFESLFAKL